MKTVFLIIIISICISCNSQLIQYDSRILGNWYLRNMNGILCNACPWMEFGKNGIGEITLPSKRIIGFTYVFASEDKIAISFQEQFPFFNEREYFYKISTENNLYKLSLYSNNREGEYILSRSKQ